MKISTSIFAEVSPVKNQQVASKTTTQHRKPSLLIRYLSFLFFGLMMMCSGQSWGQVLTEDFSYTAATLATANGWAAHSGTGTNDITITSPSLTYPSHPGSGVGNAVSMATSGQDINRTFTGITTGSVYTSFLINVSAAQATGDYCAGLYTSSSSFPLRLYVKSTTGGFFFGLSKSNGAVTYETTVRTFGTTYLMVGNYIYNGAAADDVVNLWINPALGGAEGAATIPAVNGAVADVATIIGVYLRQGSATNASTQRVDAIRVGTTWASVTAAAAIPVVSPASPTGTVGVLLNYNISATNSPSSYAISSGTLPAGLTLTPASGLISGTPTTAGSVSVDVTATNGSGPSLPATLSFTINPGNQVIGGLPGSDTKTFGAVPYNLSATASSGLTVTYSSLPAGVVTFVGNQVTIVGAGSTTIIASQAGDANWNGAVDVTQSLTVNKATQTITFGSLINRNDVDPNFQLTGTASSGLPVTYTSSVPAVAIIVDNIGNPDVNGNYVDILSPGITIIEATQPGNANYFPASVIQQSQTIINTNLLNQTITFGPLSNKTYGDANFQLTGTASSGLAVTYTSLNTAVATIVDNLGNLDPAGTYIDIIGPGTTTITASQTGNGTYNPAPNVPQNFTVDIKPLTVAGATADNKPYDGTTAATISGSSLVGVEGLDIVSITGFAGTFADANANNAISVTAGLTLGGADAVKYSLTQPTGLSANIIQASQTITFGTLADKSPGDPNFNYTATASSGLTVSYSSSDPSVAQIVSGSLVHIGVQGASTITATQGGNSNYLAATPVLQTQNVVPPAPVSIFANPITDANPSLGNPYINGQTFNSNITVSGIGRGAGIVGTSAGNRYNANNWSTAPDATEYFECTLTPNSGYRIDFSSFVYASQVSNITTAPTTFAVRSSVDGFTANIGSPVSGTSATISTIPLTAGIYQGITSPITFRIYGWGGTSAGSTFSINDFIFNGNVFVAPPTATFVKTNVSVCGGTNDGTITVTPGGTGPFSYSWTGTTGSNQTPFTAGNVSSLTGLPTGYYNVSVTDGNLNTVTITGIHVGYAFSVYITNSGSLSSACGNTGTIILYGNAGVLPYTYSLDGITYVGTNTFTNLAAGPYTGYIKDGAGCVSTKAITVAAAPAIVVSPFVRAASSCSNDGSIEIYRTGGIPPYTYSLDDITYQSGNKYLNLAAGLYTAYVKDSKGCVGSQAVTVTQGAALGVTETHTNTSTCVNDGSIKLFASGGVAPYTYSLDGITYVPGNTFSDLSANTYTGYVKDFKGCLGQINVTINLNTISVTAYATPATSCVAGDGKIQLFRTGGSGPYTYSLDGNTYQASTLFTNLAPDYYVGYVKDSKACIGQLIDILVGPESCLSRPVAGKGNNTHAVQAEANRALSVHAYPNPTATEFVLRLEGFSTEKVAIIVTDILGRKIYQTTGSGQQQYKFGSNFNTGLYHVQVIQGADKKSIRLVKD